MKPFRRLPAGARYVSGDRRPLQPDSLHFESAPQPDVARRGIGFESLNPFPMLDRGEIVRSAAGSYSRRVVESYRGRELATFVDVGEGQERPLAVDKPAQLAMTANETRMTAPDRETRPVFRGQFIDVAIAHPQQLQAVLEGAAYRVAQGLDQRRAFDASRVSEEDGDE